MKAIRFFAAACAAVLALSCTSQSEVKVDVELPTAAEVDSVSYLIGVNFGSFLKGNNFAEDLNEINMTEVKKGMQDFLAAEGTPYDPDFGTQFKIDPNKMGQILNGFITKKQNYKAAVNLAKEEAFLAENATKEGVDTTASGLQYKMENAGGEYKVAPQDTVWVNYKGTLLDGTVFDENDSTRFIANRVIKGWTEGLGLLGEGGKATLYIPAELAYGVRGNRNIAPNSTLIFDVEVLKIGKFVPKEENKK
ncbi:MAG: FKBP-type peptidyl-prolyl cis-trans isomerase [Bacteroidales bacterium]|nr:FKBP-type peptidyl-prolyl cis-trans isomerase [Bacteroidales bacterium]MBQ6689724.1 FKBP-type peptidyl-prolyl cis-trans isomerase [Bacteroidales bacterium]